MSKRLIINEMQSVNKCRFCYRYLTLLNYVFLNFFPKSTILSM